MGVHPVIQYIPYFLNLLQDENSLSNILYFPFDWYSQTYLLCPIPIRQLVSTSIGATKRNISVRTTGHVVNKNKEIVNGIVCELNFIRCKEFRPTADAFLLKVRKITPRHIKEKLVCCCFNAFLRVQVNQIFCCCCHDAIVDGNSFFIIKVDSACSGKGG